MEAKTSDSIWPVLKIFYAGEIRRLSNSKFVSWDFLVSCLNQILGESGFHPELRISYFDNEGDEIVVGSQIEWDAALLYSKELDTAFRLNISDWKQPRWYFKDSPMPETVGFYVDSVGEKQLLPARDLQESQGISAEAIISCLEACFPGEKILPWNVPSWLVENGVMKSKKKNLTSEIDDFHYDVDVDVDVNKLSKAINQQVDYILKKFGASAEDLTSARQLSQAQLLITPNDPLSYYQAARASLLLHNLLVKQTECDSLENEIFSFLERSIELGFSDVGNLSEDPSFEKIRNTTRFQQIINKVSTKKVDSPTVESKTNNEVVCDLYQTEKDLKKSAEVAEVVITSESDLVLIEDYLEKTEPSDENVTFPLEEFLDVEEEAKELYSSDGQTERDEFFQVPSSHDQDDTEFFQIPKTSADMNEEEAINNDIVSALSTKWQKEYEILKEMGFGTEDLIRCLELLYRYNGDVDAVVGALCDDTSEN